MNDAALTEEWYERARPFLLRGRTWAKGSGDADLAESFRVAQSVVERVEAGRRRMVLVGPFSAGKTSFLNRLIQAGEDIRLPVGLGETTAIPTVVRPDERTALFLWQDGRLVEAPDSARKEFLALRQDNIGPILKMYLETQTELIFLTRMEECWRDLEFLDLPGLSGQDARVDGIARMGVRGSDGVLYVTNLKQGGLTRTDIAFIEEAVGQSVPMVVVPTHLDLVPPSARSVLLETLRNQVRSLKANVVEIIETGEDGARTTSETVTRLRHFMSRLDKREALRRNLQVVMQGLTRAAEHAQRGDRRKDPYLMALVEDGLQLVQLLSSEGVASEHRPVPTLSSPPVRESRVNSESVSTGRLPVPTLSLPARRECQIEVSYSKDEGWSLQARNEQGWRKSISNPRIGSPDVARPKLALQGDFQRVPWQLKTVCSPRGTYRVGYDWCRVFVGKRYHTIFDPNGGRSISAVAVSDQGTVLVGGTSLLLRVGLSGDDARAMVGGIDDVTEIVFLPETEKWVSWVRKGNQYFLIEADAGQDHAARVHTDRWDSVQGITSADSLSWGTAAQRAQEFFIVVNGDVVAGPFAYAASPVFLSSGDRWAARVLVEGGATIAVSERGNLGRSARAGVFDEVSAPKFLADGRVVFVAVRNGLGSIETL